VRLQWTSLRSKVARRLLLLFFLCALVPVGALSILSFTHVTNQLTQQAERRLHQASKVTAMAVLARLQGLETDLMSLAESRASLPRAAMPRIPAERADQLREGFLAIALLEDDARQVPLLGRLVDPPEPAPEGRAHLASGKTLLVTTHPPGRPPRLLLSRLLDSGGARPKTLVGEANLELLFDISSENTLPPMAEFCLLDADYRVIARSLPGEVALPASASREMRNSVSGRFEWVHGDEEYLASYWTLFTKPAFLTHKWILVLSEPKAHVLAPVANFRTLFPLVIASSLVLVLLLSTSQIRRRMVPLEKLQQGTRRIANRDFEVEVEVDSDDEFQEFASSFNAMAKRLSDHFSSLATMIDIDRAILSAIDTRRIVNTILQRTRDVYACDAVGLLLLDPDTPDTLRAFVSRETGARIQQSEIAGFLPEDAKRFEAHPESLSIGPDDDVPRYLEPFTRAGVKLSFVLPLFVNQQLAGAVCVGHGEPGAGDPEDLVYARQLADQAAIALSNARSIEENRVLAYHDSLTGLPNRLMFNERLRQAIAVARRHGQRLAVCLLDLDGFKRVNDSLELAGRLSGALRVDSLARLGGDEFTILLTDLAAAEDAARVAQRVLAAIPRPFTLESQEVFITASIGIAVYPADGRDPETLVKNADAAMYHAKDGGRNNYRFFSRELNLRASRRLTMEAALRKALEREEMEVYFQPLIDVESREVVEVEALARWQHPDLGLVAPMNFIPLAEETGLIVPIGDWVLRTACAQVKEWQRAGLPGLRLSVNLSGRQLGDDQLLDSVGGALLKSRLRPRDLGLELTEGILMQADEATMQRLDGLKKLGVRLSIDDFGTGYASLTYLKHFPLDGLKIDRSFIKDITHRPEDAAITRAVITMAHSLKLQVVAEGVETERQLLFLREHGCDAAQGSLISKPLPPDGFEKFLGEWPEK
jgi:diguanylate cyclase (GGDEF)-like protein